MLLLIQANRETYLTDVDILYQVKSEEENSIKIFLKSKSLIIEKITDYVKKTFNLKELPDDCFESNENILGLLIFHNITKDSHEQLCIKVSLDGEKLNFPQFYLEKEKNIVSIDSLVINSHLKKVS